MILFLLLLLQIGLVPVLTGLSLAAIAGLFGFAVPLFDMFNHFQLIWFVGLAVSLGISLLVFRRQGRNYVRLVGGLGFLASAILVVPELVAAFSGYPPVPPDTQTVRLMSRNLFGMNYGMARVADAIEEADPDIIALQEYFSEQRDGLRDRLIGEYPHVIECMGGDRASLAVYSRLPFAGTSDSHCPNNYASRLNKVGWLAVQFSTADGREFTVVNTHLNWPIRIAPLRDTSLDWPDRIAAMTSRKSVEYAEVASGLETIEGPLVLVGDFNATPWSYELRDFAERAGLDRQTHNLFTWPARFYIRGWRQFIPFLPLDHLFTRDGILVHSVSATAPAGSDHLALLAEMSVPAG